MALKKIRGVRVEPLLLPTYLAVVEGSVGSPMFRQFFAKVNGKKTDILRGGRVSCAFHTSSILKLFNLVQEVQVTVNRLRRDLEASGWYEIARPKKGCIVFWGAKPADRKRMQRDAQVYQPMVSHCGFFVGRGTAVHNDGEKELAPVRASIRYRSVDAYYWHDALDAIAPPARPSPRHRPGVYWQPNR